MARVVFGFCAALGCDPGAAQSPEPPNEVRYRVECGSEPACRVDVATYVGYRVFVAQCASCHAADALGSSFAPDLTSRLRGRSAREFFVALDRGYLGPRSTMPPRGRDPSVAAYYDELWAFLSARRDGALPPGVPELLREPQAESRR